MLKLLFGLFVVFNLALPKAGLALGGIPITFGYMLTLLVFAVMAPSALHRRLLHGWLIAWLAITNGAIALALASFNGIDNLPIFLSYLLGFCVIPAAMILLVGPSHELRERVLTLLVPVIRFVCAYGIFLFVYFIVQNEFIDIPFITTTGSESVPLAERHNLRAPGLSKLISTYNNGNIFGVCMLMMLPIYDHQETSGLWRLVARLALVLTFSRTVWLVMISYDLLFSRLSRTQKLLSVAGLIICGIGLLAFAELDAQFLFDPDLGGRASNIEGNSFNLLHGHPFDFISEILFVSTLYALGLPGTLSTMSLLLAPACFLLIRGRRSPLAMRCGIALSLYLFASLSDAAAIYAPVMLIFWLVFWLGANELSTPTARPRQRAPAVPQAAPASTRSRKLSGL